MKSGLVDFANPDYVGYAKACGAQGFRVESLGGVRSGVSGRAGVGQADPDRRSITRLAIPHYSPNPAGILAAIEESIMKKLEGLTCDVFIQRSDPAPAGD